MSIKKLTRPTWANQNSVKVHQAWGLSLKTAKERVKRNDEIARIVKSLGWEFRDGVGIAECYGSHYSLNFVQPVPTHCGGTGVHFSFRWDNQGGEDFMRGEMHAFYSYSANKTSFAPWATFEIHDISEKYLTQLNTMAGSLIAAVDSQLRTKLDAN